MTAPLLEIRGLSASYHSREGITPSVRGADLDVGPGEIVALVGESGSGKSTLAQAVVGLLPPGGRIDEGRIGFGGRDLAALPEREIRAVRGRQIGLIPQDPGVSLNPVHRVGHQVAETLRVHGLATRASAREAAIELLRRAGLPDPETRARQYPHELSGGMRQRVLIAIAIAARPRLIIADEPTSALDVTVQRVILDDMQRLAEESGTAVLLVTHDLGVAADRAHRLAVMHEGRIVECGPVAEVLRRPRVPYTRRLLGAGAAGPAAAAAPPPARGGGPIVTVENLVKDYPLPRVKDGSRTARAVGGVSFDIARGETLALVGESGSGKTTTARMVLRLLEPTSGRIVFDGQDVTAARGAAVRELRRRVQLVYQNPYASLNPRFSVEEVIVEPLRAFGIGDRAARAARAADLLDRVGLPASYLRRRPAELSGGQRQRVAIARALALSPDLVVCDEPVSALDVPVRAQVLDLLMELQRDTGVAYLLISHDLAVVRRVAHRVAVMRAGRIVETGTTAAVFDRPAHDYTRRLLAAIPGSAYRRSQDEPHHAGAAGRKDRP
ncbi:dipeptide ABC transporter ATP-binding protein [Nonomuraea sp. NPDC050783]|uniref:dipeptide ABC transporter ATP-binding protein n=1 Tax=Nonomuraea sp. NPDC050783 TaxID=3154634 RepID=UPI003466E289